VLTGAPESSERISPVHAAAHREAAPFLFLARAQASGVRGALVTISQIDGGAPKPLGTQMAVLEDGRHVGHVSGGCVEAAIAAEVAPMIAGGRDEIIRFGKGSRFIDIRFPCGGGVDLLVHVSPDEGMLAEALARFERREAFAIAFVPDASRARVRDASATGWVDGTFVRSFLPRTKLVLCGRGPDFEVLARVAAAAEFDLWLASPDANPGLGEIALLKDPTRAPLLPLDPWTATVLLFHEHEWEDAILTQAVAGPGFYVGALGSLKTHAKRRERLAARGVPATQINRIHGPIGLIDRARDPGMLALSVLAEITAERARLERT
jgi:xanthine dehydrogenase accessory factor